MSICPFMKNSLAEASSAKNFVCREHGCADTALNLPIYEKEPRKAFYDYFLFHQSPEVKNSQLRIAIS